VSYLFDATTEKMTGQFTTALDCTAAGGDGNSVTVAMFFKMANHPASGSKYYFTLANNTSTAVSCVSLAHSATDDRWVVIIEDTASSSAGSPGYTDTGGTFDGLWVGWVGQLITETDRNIYVKDIGNVINDGDSSVIDTMTHITVNDSPVRGGSGGNDAHNIAEVAIWDTALSTADITSYLSGIAASGINPTRLRGYWPLDTDRDTEQTILNEGLDSTGDLTFVGVPTYSADHPTITSGSIVPQIMHNRLLQGNN
jgi:hypothetical protein